MTTIELTPNESGATQLTVDGQKVNRVLDVYISARSRGVTVTRHADNRNKFGEFIEIEECYKFTKLTIQCDPE